MTTRAFIVAVEHYPESTATSRHLPGTIASAERFAGWLQKELGVDKKNVVFCSSGDSDFKTHGTTTPQIKRAILDLIRTGHNDTECLFVYQCGHGVMLPSREFDLDLLLCSDFVEPQISGYACIEVNELTELFARSLGAGTHLYFIDACRARANNLDATRLGITPFDATSGEADWFQLSSGKPSEAVPTDSLFIDSLLNGLSGQSRLIADEHEEGRSWITFQNVAESIADSLAIHQREIFVRSKGKADFRIADTTRAQGVSTIVDDYGIKSPPVKLLTEFEEIVFLGETNGQLPMFVSKAFALREKHKKGRWRKLEILSIEDLHTAFRYDKPTKKLEEERAACESYFQNDGISVADQIALYRYRYVGTYGSFWKGDTGKRWAHVSAGLVGEDIRVSPASDYVDFASSRHPKVDRYFDLVGRVIQSDDCRCIFYHPQQKA